MFSCCFVIVCMYLVSFLSEISRNIAGRSVTVIILCDIFTDSVMFSQVSVILFRGEGMSCPGHARVGGRVTSCPSPAQGRGEYPDQVTLFLSKGYPTPQTRPARTGPWGIYPPDRTCPGPGGTPVDKQTPVKTLPSHMLRKAGGNKPRNEFKILGFVSIGFFIYL